MKKGLLFAASLIAILAVTAVALGAVDSGPSAKQQRERALAQAIQHASRHDMASAARRRRNAGNRGPRGPVGPVGPAGPQGPGGPQGPAGGFTTANVIAVNGPSVAMCDGSGGSCAVASSIAQCPTGKVVLGGGWDGENNPPVNATEGFNKPALGNTAWEVIMANNATIPANFHAVAICAG